MLFLVINTILFLIWYRKVHLLEDSTGNIHLKNLSMHQATNEEEGMAINHQGIHKIKLVLFRHSS